MADARCGVSQMMRDFPVIFQLNQEQISSEDNFRIPDYTGVALPFSVALL